MASALWEVRQGLLAARQYRYATLLVVLRAWPQGVSVESGHECGVSERGWRL